MNMSFVLPVVSVLILEYIYSFKRAISLWMIGGAEIVINTQRTINLANYIASKIRTIVR